MRRLLGLLALPCAFCACTQVNATVPSASAGPQNQELIDARMRRLSNAEYEKAASELLGRELDLHGKLPPDVRQEGFTLNDKQAVPAAFGTRLAQVADEIATQAAEEHLDEMLPCARTASRACAHRFVRDYARRAFRRPVSARETQQLDALFDAGKQDGGGFSGGVRLVLSALLQMPSFLYLSELGNETATGRRELTSREMAASLAFTVRGGPPDEELLELAEADALVDPEVRAEQARRLLGQSDTRHHYRRFVLEWLEVDDLEDTAKDAELAPRYEPLKAHMLAETRDFVDEVMVHRGASLRSLLTAGFASVDPTMARYYGLQSYGPRVSLLGSARLGLLQQASFLAAHAHEDSTSPVKRGDFVMRKLLCTTLPRPQELNIEVTIPAPDPKLTTRARYAAHVTNDSCQGCHASIDPLGFTFENFDAAGHLRTRENGQRVDTSGGIEQEGQWQSFGDSMELSRWLANNPRAHECFARHAFRYFTAQSDPKVEQALLHLTESLPEQDRENLLELVVAYVKSDLFMLRGDPK